MPICADPSETCPVRLQADRDKPDATTFHVRFLTARESARFSRLIRDAQKAGDDEVAFGLYEQALSLAIVRVDGAQLRGQPVPPDAKPTDYLTLVELMELSGLIASEPLDEEIRRKKASASSPATRPEPSANGAARDLAPVGVSTAPASTTPSA